MYVCTNTSYLPPEPAAGRQSSIQTIFLRRPQIFDAPSKDVAEL